MQPFFFWELLRMVLDYVGVWREDVSFPTELFACPTMACSESCTSGLFRVSFYSLLFVQDSERNRVGPSKSLVRTIGSSLPLQPCSRPVINVRVPGQCIMASLGTSTFFTLNLTYYSPTRYTQVPRKGDDSATAPEIAESRPEGLGMVTEIWPDENEGQHDEGIDSSEDTDGMSRPCTRS